MKRGRWKNTGGISGATNTKRTINAAQSGAVGFRKNAPTKLAGPPSTMAPTYDGSMYIL
jgi:hypothetical protein